jgi:RNA polymerase sigma-70 factor (ECF subfamily)
VCSFLYLLNTRIGRCRSLCEGATLQDEFEQFYRENVRLVYATAMAQTANSAAAEDLTQETFVRAWKNLSLLRPMDPPMRRSWLLRTVRNAVIDTFRQESRREAREMADWEMVASKGDAGSTASALRVDVARALAGLRVTDREIVVLRYFGELTSREIGETLGIPEGTVRQRLTECRRTLSELLASWDAPNRQEERGN